MGLEEFCYVAQLHDTTLDAGIARVRQALAEVGFGILTEIDVQAVFAQKLGVDFGSYKILGACNPQLAHRGLSAAPGLGLLLPCNVVVRALDQGTIEVSVTKPTAMFRFVDDPALAELASDADARLRGAVAALTGARESEAGPG